MQTFKLKPVALILGFALLLDVSGKAPMADEVSPVDMVAAMEKAFGVTPGQRRNHTKGTCAVGEFTGLTDGAGYSRSGLFSGSPVPVTARFSVGGGDPHANDSDKGVRGMALEFKLPDGGLQHMTMLNVPIFGASVPQTFFDLLVALKPDEATGHPNPDAVKAFAESHPDFQAMGHFIETHNPPTSYANSPYYSLHAFRFMNKDNNSTLVRWEFQPQDGVKPLSDEELQKGVADFLEKTLIDRAGQSSIRWDMYIRIGQPGDAETDASQPWPEDRLKVKVGTLSLTGASSQADGTCEKINFDPLVVADGIAPTDDPVLRIRSGAYAVSYGKRLSGQ
jgi:catalase